MSEKQVVVSLEKAIERKNVIERYRTELSNILIFNTRLRDIIKVKLLDIDNTDDPVFEELEDFFHDLMGVYESFFDEMTDDEIDNSHKLLANSEDSELIVLDKVDDPYNLEILLKNTPEQIYNGDFNNILFEELIIFVLNVLEYYLNTNKLNQEYYVNNWIQNLKIFLDFESSVLRHIGYIPYVIEFLQGVIGFLNNFKNKHNSNTLFLNQFEEVFGRKIEDELTYLFDLTNNFYNKFETIGLSKLPKNKQILFCNRANHFFNYHGVSDIAMYWAHKSFVLDQDNIVNFGKK